MTINLIRFFILIMILLINLTQSSNEEPLVFTRPVSQIEVSQTPPLIVDQDLFQIRSNPSIDLLNENKDYVGLRSLTTPLSKGMTMIFTLIEILNNNRQMQEAFLWIIVILDLVLTSTRLSMDII